MALPINIHELIHGSTVEWERIEFKEGWNPEIILHTICAFANDVNNWGGGYLVIGIAEENGRAVLPPKGIEIDNLDKMQLDIHRLCQKIVPAYTPVVAPYEIDGKHILVVWVPGGETRPYKASRSLAKGAEKLYYVRRGSSSPKANEQEEQQLMQLAAKIPFDDRINHHASIDDLSLAEIRMFLQDVKSDLFKSSEGMTFEELVRVMQIARGPSEYLRPVNVGLLFFSETPEKFFPYTQIEVNIYHDDIGDSFTEKVFKGAIHQQLRKALSHIKTQVIQEHVQKVEGQAEAIRFYSYPFQAIEEALANAVYHKSYEIREPIEVNVRLDQIEILSHGGPMPPLSQDDFKKERIISRRYLNRRIGDFLRELHLTEGKGTGIPKIRRAMRNNGSQKPVFETDDDRSYFLTILPKRTWASEGGQVGGQVLFKQKQTIEYGDPAIEILLMLQDEDKSSSEIVKTLGLQSLSGALKRQLRTLIGDKKIAYLYPDKPRSSKQKYILTTEGRAFLETLKKRKDD